MDDIPFDSIHSAEEHIFMLMQALYVFEELGLMRVETSGPYLHYEMFPGKTAKLVDHCGTGRILSISGLFNRIIYCYN